MPPELASRDVPFGDVLARMIETAWLARSRARVIGPTQVGCAVLADTGDVYGGCNVEHRFRSHDIHAETNALSTLVAGGADSCWAVLVAAERSHFTPCGACLDWIFEIGGGECRVGFQSTRDGDTTWFRAAQLMPHYPY